MALPFGPVLAGAAVLGGVLSCAALLALAASMAGTSIGSVDHASVGAVLWGTGVGTALLVRMAALAFALLLAAAARRAPLASLTSATIGGAVALATLAWSGHGAMDEGATGWIHLVSDIVHLLAAGVWVGGLIGLVLLVFRRRTGWAATISFSRIGCSRGS